MANVLAGISLYPMPSAPRALPSLLLREHVDPITE